MFCFISRFSLINNNQFGFLAGQNISDAPTEFFDKAFDAINQKIVSPTIFLDFSKAFVTFDQGNPLKKL